MGRPRIHPPRYPERQAPLCGCVTVGAIRYGLCDLHWQRWKALHGKRLFPLHATPVATKRALLVAATCLACGDLLLAARFPHKGFTCTACMNRRRRQRDVSATDPSKRRLVMGRTLLAATCSQCDILRQAGDFSRDRHRRGWVCDDCAAERSRSDQRRKQAESLSAAPRRGYVWTGPELEMLMRDDLSLVELAQNLGRTYATVSVMRSKVRNDSRYSTLAGTSLRANDESPASQPEG